MKVTVNQCEFCNNIFHDDAVFEAHHAKELKKQEFLKMYPAEIDDGCKFSNGEYKVPHTKDWTERLARAIEELVGDIGYSFKSYAWYRVLSDSHDILYSIALRLTHICPKCHCECGQAYYANKCC